VAHAYRFLPGRTRGEGFFLAALRKPADAPEHQGDAPKAKRSKKEKAKRPAMPVPAECKGWLTTGDYTFKVQDTDVVALPTDMEELHATLSERLYVLKAGITLAELKGRDALPAHELAMSTALRSDAFARCELSYADALRYLRRDAIALPSDMPRGFVIVTYRNIPLGFVKNIGNRANNLYPQEWRIRSGHLPEGEVRVLVN
jgi:NOL1/NOP2/fmu family ribosome biogenesis protein